MHGIWCKVPVSVVIWIHSTLFQFTFKVLYELKQNNTFPLPGDGWSELFQWCFVLKVIQSTNADMLFI